VTGDEAMREQLQQRLASLRAEYESGQRALTDLERKLAALRDTVLRISGAIQVLEEELAAPEPVTPDEPPQPSTLG
jgi:chromosome segregation ATPase